MIKVKLCQLAKKHHEESPRQFAHVFHKRNTICVTPEFYDLPQTYQAGILLHEIGHFQLSRFKHSEEDADEFAQEMSGVEIIRKSYRGMKKLECVRLSERGAAVRSMLRCKDQTLTGFCFAPRDTRDAPQYFPRTDGA